MFTTILFDFDGTLVPSLELWMKTYQYGLNFYNLELNDPKLFINYFYQPLPLTAAAYGITNLPEFAKHLEKGYLESFAQIQLYPGARELLETCKRNGLTLGLVTSSPRGAMGYTLSKLDISDYFDVIVTGDEVKQPKPNPEAVLVALKQLNKTPGETICVGDYSNDILAGKAAGTATALYLPQSNAIFYNVEDLKASNPDFIFSSYDELMGFVLAG